MTWEKNRVDTVEASGAAAMNGTLDNTAMSDQGYPNNRIARVAITGHGIVANSKIMLPDVAVFDGLRNIRAVDTNYIEIDHNDIAFTATTPEGTELWYVGQTYNEPWELIGFKVHLSAVGATDENLTVSVDAAKGAAFDWKVWDYTMLGKQDIIWEPSVAIPMKANDILMFNYTNTDVSTWGVEIMSRRLA